MDQGELTTFEFLSAVGHLQDNLSDFRQKILALGDNGRFDLSMLPAILCSIASAQSDTELACYHQKNIPRASRTPSMEVLPSRETGVR